MHLDPKNQLKKSKQESSKNIDFFNKKMKININRESMPFID